ncbi:MAG: DUF262 domain-containing protein [Magnetococcales bacterium]|nr:DUF262 domain-containing protein [Magnetococcales bacterium]MBF0115909.1 DUF262 domain-containing protein [Magnetococcales bacterium]
MSQKIEVKHEIICLFDLIRRVEQGNIRIPTFHQPFAWERAQICELMDSICNHYPIGSLLLWNTDGNFRCRDSIGPILLKNIAQNRVNLVLDGQQRLTSLFGTLRMPSTENLNGAQDPDPGRWCIYFNAERQIFEHLDAPNTTPREFHFPLWAVMDTFAFLTETERMRKGTREETGQRYIKRVQEVVRALNNYMVPLTTIENTHFSQAVTILTRLNGKGGVAILNASDFSHAP